MAEKEISAYTLPSKAAQMGSTKLSHTLPQEAIACALVEWCRAVRRAFPWREQPTPYRVWMSEIMLQQTRIDAALPYFERFMAALPDVAALAVVDEDALLKLWEGLGYYSRARHAQAAARIMMKEYGGALPADYELLKTLPGIGPYTAGAIASIAFGLRVPAVDGNVLRVLARLTASGEDVLAPAVHRQFFELARVLVPAGEPGLFNEAIMELGETICLPNAAPRCGECPVAAWCEGRRRGIAADLPVRRAAKPRRVGRRELAVIRGGAGGACVLLHKRAERGLLANLWELPTAKDARAWGVKLKKMGTLPKAKHVFSHVEWHMTADVYRMAEDTPAPEGCAWVGRQDMDAYALPSAFRAYREYLWD